jgi:excisionase family DNA binding protein
VWETVAGVVHEAVVGGRSRGSLRSGREVFARSVALVLVTIFRSAAPVQPLTLTVDQAATVLGVARSTAYELVRAGDIQSIRLRRRIVVPVAHLADRLGVTAAEVWTVVEASQPIPPSPPSARPEERQRASLQRHEPTLF